MDQTLRLVGNCWDATGFFFHHDNSGTTLSSSNSPLSRICKHDAVHEKIHDSNAVHGRMGPGYILHWQPALSGCFAVRRKELRDLQMGRRTQVCTRLLNNFVAFLPIPGKIARTGKLNLAFIIPR